ncbi:TrkA family potassium uptake protein [Dactylosporangium sp. NPDC005555]|uniref:potassium channel family protein n=1 Tax=Dactylosporangium sp. NPDC005555 TaxID=3154889 RepID=UPI0033AA5042
MSDSDRSGGVVVIGLGRFGGQVAESLTELGHEVLGIDENAEIVQKLADVLTHVVHADSTDEEALRQIGVAEFNRAVVGIGTDIEASVLTVLALTELGVEEIWAKAISAKHGRILERVGARHVVYPEADMGERVAHLVTGQLLDFIELDDGYAIAKVCPPEETIGQTLTQLGLRSKHGITVVAVKRAGREAETALPDTVIEHGDTLIVSGPTKKVERIGDRGGFPR